MLTKTPINEYSTLVQKSLLEGGGSYTEIGGGINYQKDDGSFAESNPAIVASVRTGINWECYTTHNRVGFKSNISTGTYSVFSQIGNTGKILKSKPVGIAYLNIDTKEYQIFANLQSSVGVVSGNTIRYNDAFLNCDLEYVILKDRLKQNLHIKSKAGFPASPYPANKTYVVVVTKFDLANFELPSLVDERGTTAFNNSGDDTDGELKFSDQRFEMSLATDNAGATQAIKKRLVKVAGSYYYLEGLPYSYLVGASYPVLLDYTTVSSNPSDNATWTAGTYFISSSIAATNLTVNSGAIIKFDSGITLQSNSTCHYGDTSGWAYFTSKNDDTVGETITGSSGSPTAGDWGYLTVRYYDSGNNYYLQNCVVRYGTNIVAVPSATGNQTINAANCIFSSTSQIALSAGGRAFTFNVTGCQFLNLPYVSGYSYLVAKGCLFKGCTTAITHAWLNFTIRNCTFDGNGTAIASSGGDTLTVYDSIITNNTTKGISKGAGSTLNLNYCMIYGNTASDAPTANNNPITPANPNFSTGTAATGYIGDMTYFLNQSTSPCKDAGSASASSLGMDTYTTATDKTTDSGTVDIGYHYTVADVADSGGTEYTADFTDDAISSTDTLGRGIAKAPTDAITSSDGLGKGSTRSLSDSAAFSADTIKKAVARGFLDAATLSEIFNTSSGRGISFTDDEITLSDALDYASGRGLSFSDAITIADTLLRGMEKKPTDAITSVDAFVRNVSRGLSDSLSISDLLNKSAGRSIQLIDAISMIDALLRAVSKNVVDNVPITDSLSRATSRALVDSIVSTDALSKAITRILVESGIGSSDTFSTSTALLLVVDVFKSAVATSISNKSSGVRTLGLSSKVASGANQDSEIS